MSLFCVPSPFRGRQPAARKFSEFPKYYDVDWSQIIGKGGFSTVYKGRERSTGKPVAIKKIPRQHSSARGGSSNKVLKQEINAAVKVKEHSSIVSLFDVFVASDVVVLCMEYMEGDVLFKRIVNSGPLTESAARIHFHKLAHALRHLHANNIVHRDLKPENLMFSQKISGNLADEDNSLKITDFGLSKILPDNAAGMMQTFCGTPAYLAPEAWKAQFAGQEYDKKVDTWSLGVTLFVVISGYHPFDPTGSADLKTLRENVLNLKWAYDDPGWDSVTTECKDLISNLICSHDKRYTADQILEHPWFDCVREGDRSSLGKKRPMRRSLSERIKALQLNTSALSLGSLPGKKAKLIISGKSGSKNYSKNSINDNKRDVLQVG